MSNTVLIPEFDTEQMLTGYMWVTKVDEKGPQRGLMPVSEVADALRQFVDWEASGRHVQLISRFDDNPFLAWGQNGAKWIAIKAIDPAEYYLVSVSGKAYPVKLPRLIAKVGNHTATYLYWTDAETLTPETPIYPLIVGNIDSSGWVCMGTSPLKCKGPDDIDKFIRQVVEIPATGTYLAEKVKMDDFFAGLTERWDPEIGRKQGITLGKLLRSGTMAR